VSGFLETGPAAPYAAEQGGGAATYAGSQVRVEIEVRKAKYIHPVSDQALDVTPCVFYGF
jgi:hypothetical protein